MSTCAEMLAVNAPIAWANVEAWIETLGEDERNRFAETLVQLEHLPAPELETQLVEGCIGDVRLVVSLAITALSELLARAEAERGA